MSLKSKQNDLPGTNPAINWAAIIVNELAANGLRAVCIAPGSRSTPLALAFHAHPTINVFVHLDERSAAFFALGMALRQQKATAVLCTSGTAGGNFLPAIIEAKMSNVPLLVLTADRPPELRHSGANQTIDQIKMFGDQVLWSVDVGLPEANTSSRTIQYLKTLATRALFTAEGIVKGPVHLNFPFRKPLEPVDAVEWEGVVSSFEKSKPFTRIEKGFLQPSKDQINYVSKIIEDHPRGLIVCGPDKLDNGLAEAVAQLSNLCGYPLLADPLSGIRFGNQVKNTAIISGYETFLSGRADGWPHPEVILRFGRVPASKWLHEYLWAADGACHIHVRENGVWADGDQVTTHFLQVSPTLLCQQVANQLHRSIDEAWIGFWQTSERMYLENLSSLIADNFFDGAVVGKTLDQVPSGTILFAGNSLPVRHLDQFCPPSYKSLSLFSNRGASGIDGNISTALGLVAQNKDPLVMLLGDITFYHDSNGLLAIKKFGLNNVTIVLINNNGGGIFQRLPVAKFKPEFEELFLTAHDLQFQSYAQLYGLDYHLSKDFPSFSKALGEALNSHMPTLIEVQTNAANDEAIRKQIISKINAKLSVGLLGQMIEH